MNMATAHLRNGDGRVDLVKVVQLVSPFLMFAVVGFLFTAGDIEHPKTKSERIEAMIELHIAEHNALPGHAVALNRHDNTEDVLNDLRDRIDRQSEQIENLTRILARIEARIDR